MVKRPSGKRIFDRLRISLPIIGPPALMSELGRFARTLSVMVSAGIKLQETMELLPQATTNMVFRDALNKVNERLLLGEGLSAPMTRISLFPPLLVQMVAVGEESNTLDFTMGVVADFFETSAEEKTAAMVGMIGPISTIGIALLVGFIALSVIMPMYTLTGAFG
jgi:type IV pilus assembly protein PilC